MAIGVQGEHTFPASDGGQLLTPLTIPFYEEILTSGLVIRVDLSGSTAQSLRTVNDVRAIMPGSAPYYEAAQSALPEIARTRIVDESLAARMAEVVNKTLQSLSMTPSEFESRWNKVQNGVSSGPHIVIQAIADIIRSHRIARYTITGGDSLDFVIQGDPTEYPKFSVAAPILFAILAKEIGLDESIKFRFGVAQISSNSPVTLLYREDGKVIGAQGEPFKVAAEKEKICNPRSITDYNLDDEDARGSIKALFPFEFNNLPKSNIIHVPHEDVAYANYTHCLEHGEIQFDPDIPSDLSKEFKLQIQLGRLFAEQGYKCKFGQITYTNRGATSYVIPIRNDNSTVSSTDHLMSMQSLIKSAAKIGLILHIAISSRAITKIDDKDISGFGANAVARLAGVGVAVGIHATQPYIASDASFAHNLAREGVLLDEGLTIREVFLKGITNGTNPELAYELTNTNFKLDARAAELKPIQDLNQVLSYIESYLKDYFDDPYEYEIFGEQIKSTLIAYSDLRTAGIDDVTSNLKTLFISILPDLDTKRPFGEILSQIGETALRYRFYSNQLRELNKLIEETPEIRDVIDLIACTIFGRKYECRVSTILSILNQNYSQLSILKEKELITITSKDDGEWILPDPILAHYLYVTMDQKKRDLMHAKVVDYLYSKREWGDLSTSKQFLSLRSFLLHLIYDGNNLPDDTLNKYLGAAQSGLQYMIENRLYADYCSLAEPLIRHLEKSDKFKVSAERFRKRLIYAQLRTDNFEGAKRVLLQYNPEADDYDFLKDLVSFLETQSITKAITSRGTAASEEFRQLHSILSKLDIYTEESCFYYELIIEKTNLSLHDSIIDRLADQLEIHIEDHLHYITRVGAIIEHLMKNTDDRDLLTLQVSSILRFLNSEMSVGKLIALPGAIVSSISSLVNKDNYYSTQANAYSIILGPNRVIKDDLIVDICNRLQLSGDYSTARRFLNKIQNQLT